MNGIFISPTVQLTLAEGRGDSYELTTRYSLPLSTSLRCTFVKLLYLPHPRLSVLQKSSIYFFLNISEIPNSTLKIFVFDYFSTANSTNLRGIIIYIRRIIIPDLQFIVTGTKRRIQHSRGRLASGPCTQSRETLCPLQGTRFLAERSTEPSRRSPCQVRPSLFTNLSIPARISFYALRKEK